MPLLEHEQNASGERETARLEAFSDGVFAIAITLLILEVRLPNQEDLDTNHSLLSGLGSIWPSYLAFLLSFALILMIWLNHHELFRLVKGIDRKLIFANGALLLMVTFVPFSTTVLAQHLGTAAANTAVCFYCATFFVTSMFHNLLLEAAVYKRRLLKDDVSNRVVAGLHRSYRFGLVVYAVSAIVAIWSAVLGLVLSTLLWLLWMSISYTRKPLARAAKA
jgi:uncharacterized membrane protein